MRPLRSQEMCGLFMVDLVHKEWRWGQVTARSDEERLLPADVLCPAKRMLELVNSLLTYMPSLPCPCCVLCVWM